MNLQQFLVNLLSSPWEILPPLAILLVLLVILPKCLTAFVTSLIQGRKSKQTSELLIQTSEQFLTMILTYLNLQSATDQSTNESATDSESPSQLELQVVPEVNLQNLIDRIREVIDNA